MKLEQLLMMAGVAAVVGLSAGTLQAQDQNQRRGRGGPGGPGGDPAQFEQMMLDRTRERLEVKDDAEWKVIEPLVKKVGTLRREQVGGGMRGLFRGGRGGGGGGGNGDNNNGGGNGGGNRFRGFGGEPSPEEEALSKAIENKAPKDELKTKMAAFRKVKETKEKELRAAQDELKKILTVPQEAVALEMGLVQ